MGLLLLIPGLIFLLNGATWFSGEDQVGKILVIIGSVLILLQVIWFLLVGSVFVKASRDMDRGFRRGF